MTYDSWKATDPRDAEYDPADRDYDDGEGEPEVTAVMNPLSAQLEAEALRSRIDHARILVIAALEGAEKGYHSMPFAQLDALLTGVLVQLGCSGCGDKFDRDQASTLVCVRKHGQHAGCYYGD